MQIHPVNALHQFARWVTRVASEDDVAGARASLGSMLETTRDAAIRQRIRAALTALARTN